MTPRWTAFIGNKQVNGRALLILLLVLLVGLGGTYLVHGFQVRRNAGGLLEQAGLTEGDADKIQAISYLEQYLGLMPGDSEATAKLALLLSEQTKNRRAPGRAYLLIDDLLRRDAIGSADERRRLRREAAKLAIRLGRNAEAKEHLKELIKDSDGVADADALQADALQLESYAEERLGNDAAALSLQEVAMKKSAYQTNFVIRYTAMLLPKVGLGQRSVKADEAIEMMLEHATNSVDARLAAARYFADTRRHKLAATHVDFILHELHAPTDEVLLLAGRISLNLGDIEKARAYFEEGRKLNPANAALALELARIELSKHDTAKALALLEPSLRVLPTDESTLWKLANLLVDAQAPDKARTVNAQLKKLHETTAAGLIDYIKARLTMADGNWGAAARLLTRAGADTRHANRIGLSAYMLLAECNDHLLNPDQKLEALRRAVNQDSRNIQSALALAKAQAATGDFNSARAGLRKLLADGVPVTTELVRVLLDRAWRTNDASLLSEADRLLSAETEALGVTLLKAELYLLREQPADARALAEAERDRNPRDIRPWQFLVGLTVRDQGYLPALKVLDQAEASTGLHVEWPLRRAGLLLRAGPDMARRELPHLLDKLAHYESKDQNRLLAALADAYQSLGDEAESARLWQKVADRDGYNLQAAFALFESKIQARQLDEAEKLLGNIKRIDGEDGAIANYSEGAWRVAQAHRDHKVDGLPAAHAFLARAAAQRPSWAQVQVLDADAYDLEGLREKALEKYLAARNLGEQRLHVARRVFQLITELRPYDEAAQFLANVKNKEALETPELKRLATDFTFLNAGAARQDSKRMKQEAMARARQIAEKSSDYRDKLWFGTMASLTGDANDFAEAEKAYREACTLKPTAPETWSSLVLLLARTDPRRGAEALDQARQSLSKDDAALLLAVGYDALGHAAKANEQFQTLLKVKPSDPAVLREVTAFFARHRQFDKAAKTARTLLDVSNSDQPKKIRAQCTLALILGLQGGADRLAEAEDLVAKAQKGDPDNPQVRLVKAQLLTLQPARRLEAIQAIEGLGNSMPDLLRATLADLYEATGDWPGAERQWLTLLRAQEKDATYLDRYISGLLRHHDTTKAAVWVEKLAPDALRTLELRVAFLLAAKKSPEAVKAIEAYARTKDARLDLAARWLELAGNLDQAEKTYRAFIAASKQPESVLLLAQFLGRQKKVSEALALCDGAAATCRPEAIARTKVTILRGGGATKSQWQAVEDWLKNAIKKKAGPVADSIALKFLLAELYEYSTRPQDSISVYREILKETPRHVPSLNNLAFVRALAPEGDTTEALNHVNQALEIAGPNDELLDTRAVIYLQMKNPDRALEDLRKVSFANSGALRFFHLAQACAEAKDKAGAADAWRKALELGLQLTSIHPLEETTYERLAIRFKLGL